MHTKEYWGAQVAVPDNQIDRAVIRSLAMQTWVCAELSNEVSPYYDGPEPVPNPHTVMVDSPLPDDPAAAVLRLEWEADEDDLDSDEEPRQRITYLLIYAVVCDDGHVHCEGFHNRRWVSPDEYLEMTDKEREVVEDHGDVFDENEVTQRRPSNSTG